MLTSAVVKIARVMRLPVGLELYRGLGGTLELPESFFEADENGCDKRRDNWSDNANDNDNDNINSYLRAFSKPAARAAQYLTKAIAISADRKTWSVSA